MNDDRYDEEDEPLIRRSEIPDVVYDPFKFAGRKIDTVNLPAIPEEETSSSNVVADCPVCGAVMGDVDKHLRWHAALEKMFETSLQAARAIIATGYQGG